MTMTKALRAQLTRVLIDMERTQAYIASDRVAVCRVLDRTTCTTDYTRAPYMPAVDRSPDDALPLARITKDIGSDLCRLPNAIRSLKHILES